MASARCTRLDGTWWLPAANAKSGSLTIESNGHATLRLRGGLRPGRYLAEQHIEEDVIHGSLTDGTSVTLLVPYSDTVNWLAQGYSARHTIIGAHLTNDTAITRARFTASQLDNFLGLAHGYNRDDTAKPCSIATAQLTDATIEFHRTRTDNDAFADNLPCTAITITSCQRWRGLWNLLTTTNEFVTFCTDGDNAVITVTIDVENTTARVITPLRMLGTERAPHREASALLLTLADIPDLSTTLGSWRDLAARLPQVLNAYAGFQRRREILKWRSRPS